MMKWFDSLNAKSFISVKAIVKRSLKPIKSCRVANYELHLVKVYCEALAPEALGLSLAAANKAVTRLDDENVVEGIETLVLKGSAAPGPNMAKHMSNPVMHKRSPIAQAISDVRMAVRKIFTE